LQEHLRNIALMSAVLTCQFANIAASALVAHAHACFAGTTKAKPVRRGSAAGAAAALPAEPSSQGSSSGGAPPAIAGLAVAAATAAATGVKNLFGRVLPDRSSVEDPSRRVSAISSMTSLGGRFGSDFASAPGQLTPPTRLSTPGDAPVLAAPDSPAAAEQATPRPFLERITSSFRRRSSANDRDKEAAAAAGGALGVLIAEDESKRAAAEVLPEVEWPAGLSTSAAGAAAEAQPADAVVQVRACLIRLWCTSAG
jgi:hypothetical protein